jgi:DNA repair protein RadC
MFLKRDKWNQEVSAESLELFEAAPLLPGSSISEKLARYGSTALSGVEHLTLLVGKESVATALVRYFGSVKALSRASFRELRQFLTARQAEAVMAALSVGNVAEAEHALSSPLNNPEAIYKANLDMKGFHQEVMRVVLLDSQLRCITKLDVFKGTANECLAHPREIFRETIIYSALGFVLVHNHPSGAANPSDADLKLTKRIAAGARILKINFLDHVIVGQAIDGRLGYFSFQEAGLL